MNNVESIELNKTRATQPLIQGIGLKRWFEDTGSRLEILKGVDLEVHQGEVISITGTSGAGKSTLLHILGSLDQPSEGKVYFEGKDIFELSAKDLDSYRRDEVGFIFQFHHLLPELTALENVQLPSQLQGGKPNTQRALELLESVGMSERSKHFPAEMSGGECQRVAVARALMNNPKIIFADEPSGNLDEDNSEMLHQLFMDLNTKMGQSFVYVTHDQKFAAMAHRQWQVSHGGLIEGSLAE